MLDVQDLKLCKCKHCLKINTEGIWKPLDEFHNDKSKKDKKCSTCKAGAIARSNRFYTTNTEECKAKMKHYRKGRTHLRKQYHLLYTYGITLEDEERMLREQDYKCAICNNPPRWTRPLGVDHNHITGKVRGMLCDWCNTTLGKMGDSREGVQEWYNKVIGYLERAGE